MGQASATTTTIQTFIGSVKAVDTGAQSWSVQADYGSGTYRVANTTFYTNVLWTTPDCVGSGYQANSYGGYSSVFFRYVEGTYFAGIWTPTNVVGSATAFD